MARNFPEPAIVMLCFLWGIWLYDGYLGPPAEAPAQTQELAFQSIDRRLRLADSYSRRPEVLRVMAGVPTLDDALNRAVRQLEEVWRVRCLTAEGAVVRSILLAAAGDREAAGMFVPAASSFESRLLSAELKGRAPDRGDVAQLAALLATDKARWWHMALARGLPENEQADLREALDCQEKLGEQIARRLFWMRSAIWVLVLAGLFFIPRSLRLLDKGLHRPVKGLGYASLWPIRLTLGIFLVCELSGIGISGAYGFLSVHLDAQPSLVYLGIDSASRLIPAGLACAFLFHRSRHAFRVFGVGRPIRLGGLLGVFTLVFVLQETLRIVMGDRISIDPTGGMDLWQAGWAGLAAMLVSACIVAPISEEILYRGVLFQGLLNRFGPLAAALLSAFIFTIVHFYGLYGTLGVGILGVALALVYHATRSLPAVIIFHAIYNLTAILPDWIVNHGPLGP